MGGDIPPLSSMPVTWCTGSAARRVTSQQQQRFDGHYPYARHVRHGWIQTGDDVWVSSSVDSKLWEVFCQQCGAPDGPPGVSPRSLSSCADPIAPEHRAEHAVKKLLQGMSTSPT